MSVTLKDIVLQLLRDASIGPRFSEDKQACGMGLTLAEAWEKAIA